MRLPFARNGHTAAPPDSERLLREVTAQRDATTLLLQERLQELELALENEAWVPWGDRSAGGEFSREGLATLVRLSRLFYLKNPLIHRAVEVKALYVWGQDLTVHAQQADVDAVIQAFWDANKRSLTGQQASRALEVERQVTGNVFLALFAHPADGSVKVRSIPVEEVRAVLTNPDDRLEPWYYRRCWTQTDLEGRTQAMERLYPDWRYAPSTRPDTIAGVPVEWDVPVLHVKSGGFLHWLFGIPEHYSAQDWARAYKESLEDDATRSRALARFALMLSTPGGKRAVAASKAKLNTTYAGNELVSDTNPPPLAGSTFIGAEGTELKAMSVGGAMPPADHSRPLRVMTAAGVGLPDTFFGDPDQGNLATASTLDRPTELAMSETRQLWRDTFGELLQWVIDRAALAPLGPLRTWVLGVNPDGSVEWRDDPETGEPLDTHLDLDWPDLLEPDITKRVGAIVSAATLDGHPAVGTLSPRTLSQQLMAALGIDDVDEELEALFPETEDGGVQPESLAEALRDLRALVKRQMADARA